MPTLTEVHSTLSRLRQQGHDLYWDRDEDGQLRTLLDCETKLLADFIAINIRFDTYLRSAEAMHGAACPLYRMISECVARQRARELQRAWTTMETAREEMGA